MSKTPEQKLDDYMVAIGDQLLDTIDSAIVESQLEDVLRKLWAKDEARAYLAIRGYLQRTPRFIEDNWVWTDEQSRRYLRSNYFTTTVQPLLDRVNREFKRLNSTYHRSGDYGVRTNQVPRPLSEQLNNWLSSYDPRRDAGDRDKSGIRHIFNDGEALKRKLLTEIIKTKYDDDPKVGTGVADFKAFLTGRATDPPETITFALPGLSFHGTGRAFDFVVVLGGNDVTSTSSSPQLRRMWRDDRWEDQLHDAIHAVDPSGNTFDGPLQSPDEPWHYNYDPVPPREALQ
jgi:hypothetical protein